MKMGVHVTSRVRQVTNEPRCNIDYHRFEALSLLEFCDESTGETVRGVSAVCFLMRERSSDDGISQLVSIIILRNRFEFFSDRRLS